MSGPEVTLLNFSRGGALVQVGSRYPVRSYVRLKVTRATGEATVVTGTVAWAKVDAIAGSQIHYLIAVTFEKPIEDLAAVIGFDPQDADASATSTPDNVTRFPAAAQGPTAVPAPSPADEESVRLREELAAANARATELQAALDRREQEAVQALADQQARYDALVAELVRTANEQESEFQQLLADALATRDAERRRADQLEARYATLRQEAAKLLGLIAASTPPQGAATEAVPMFQIATDSAQAVA